MVRQRHRPAGRPDRARPATRHARVRSAGAPAFGGRTTGWRALAAGAAARPAATLALLGLAMLLAFVAQGGMAERLRLTSRLANAYDSAISASMPLAGLFRG